MSMKNSNRCDSMRLVAGRNENNRWDWKRNLNKAWLNLGAGMGMGMDNWKQQGV